ncbi:MAG: hypothetical protein ACOC1G_07110, partial [Phycisphaeraceae bacterium]
MGNAQRHRARSNGEKTAPRLPLEAWLRRRRRRRFGSVAVVAAGLAMLAAADRLVDVPWSGDTMDRFHDREVRVVRVIDGDTLEVLLPGQPGETFRVRLWGIDAPELARPDGSDAQAFSQSA